MPPNHQGGSQNEDIKENKRVVEAAKRGYAKGISFADEGHSSQLLLQANCDDDKEKEMTVGGRWRRECIVQMERIAVITSS